MVGWLITWFFTTFTFNIFHLLLLGLYGFCMGFSFPFQTFRNLSEETLVNLRQYFDETGGIDIKTNSDYGMTLVCDLGFDQNCLDLLEIFPPLVENKTISDSMISPLMKNLKEKFNIVNEGDRLIADFTIKRNYILSGFALKCFARCGVKILEIKSGICYKQSCFLKEQMYTNAEIRKEYQQKNMTSAANSIKRLSNSGIYQN